MSQLPAVKISGLTKSYGNKRVLENLDLAVPAGTVLSLLGPNGAGKTTVVEILQGLRRRGGGTVSVLGEDPGRALRAWRARIGVVSQSSADLKDFTVSEAVTHVSRFFSQPADVAETIDRVGLSDDARTRASRLSGGRRRRLDVALAIIGRPELLFLDEPTTGFDPEARHVFWDLVKDLRSDGTTVLLTTHYLDEAAHLADEVAIIMGGRVVEYGTPEALARQAGSKRTVSWIEDGVERTEPTTTPTAVVRGLMDRLAGPDGEVPGLQVHSPSLEDHYLELVSRHHIA
ncbi:ABC transporter ATP-binding protein [Actinomyces sp. Marseille-P3109]|uniref:ABC transporter ATP-binding protein n=1 Tax=Actinomyces sp. Marseille-P3109 TaxID=2083009 RepID=UPI000D54C64E|nr:ABC transporter ATP-binding protein [Actinomyces sp. Marseille-P3109]